ncbi:lipid-A-disaccharide synthase [Leptolyngbya sp. FACHB-261]|uniref:lipid-A-disaccharide synthase n=1 Tax=Leptolyngbya sp. FACHB-261 TaxID=2692806 RepID=UPI0016836F3E|nr:lipid-A-disaccharide synthase [Leptolyngbya sp. FACHB-261]MBD2099470.1 lipid-A-disaccharide synthase [Leptolyngbya sp. FACHB-261]
MSSPVDILILSNGPGELATWVQPVVRELRQQLGQDRQQVRVSVVLSPCPHASGQEAKIALGYAEVDRVQGPEHFVSFLLLGRTRDCLTGKPWSWRKQGVVLFLGGDQFFTLVVARRLGYRSVVYAEWEARWQGWIDAFGVMSAKVLRKAQYPERLTVVGDLIAEAANLNPELEADVQNGLALQPDAELIGLLPGSKPAKLAQGVPLMLAVADQIVQTHPKARFVIPVAPSLQPESLAHFAHAKRNPAMALIGGTSGKLIAQGSGLAFETAAGNRVDLWTGSPAYALLSQCRLCITTVGANTAELGALAVPMLVVVPTNQLDAMRAWDGLPGLLANLPVIGTWFAKLINRLMLRALRRRQGLLAWPNIWAGEPIVPELLGHLTPELVSQHALQLLNDPTQLSQIRERLRQVRGEPGAAHKLVNLVVAQLPGARASNRLS